MNDRTDGRKRAPVAQTGEQAVEKQETKADSRAAGEPSNPRILLVGTMDTKAEEIVVLAREIITAGATPVVLDSGVGAAPIELQIPVEIGQSDVAKASGIDLEDLWSLPRGEAVSQMRAGITAIVRRLNQEGGVDGAICIGGAGTHLVGPAFQELPLTVPKLIVSPLASGTRQFEPYMGTSNVAVMHSVVDIAGLNEISEAIYRQAAGYIVGAAKAMAARPTGPWSSRRGLIAASMNGNTTPAVDRMRLQLKESGFDLVPFHANGVGGRAMEGMIKDGRFVAVVDMTTTELAGAEFGGLMDPGPDRMEGAGRLGIPQVLVPGCLDFITTGRYEEAQREFPDHVLFAHNPELTLVRMKAEQMATLGRVFAAKANGARGPTTICVPRQGLSIPGAEGGPFSDPDADEAFRQELEANVVDGIRLRVVDAHINDPKFVDVVLDELSWALEEARRTQEPKESILEAPK